MPQLLDLLRRSNAEALVLDHFRERLTAGGGPTPPVQQSNSAISRVSLEETGFAVLAAIDASSTAVVREVVRMLAREEIPPVFSFLFPEAWALAEALRRRVTELIGVPYDLHDDGWAWSIPPGTRGWAPHRGGNRLLRRDVPELVTGWIALDTVGADQACMHIVPLEEDPGYPALDRFDAPLQAVRAVPLSANSALVWNANLLHWGGTCAPDANPRLSLSVSLGHADLDPEEGLSTINVEALDPRQRLFHVARQIDRYHHHEPDFPVDVVRWARAFVALHAARG